MNRAAGAASKPWNPMKTKLLILLTAILTLGTFSSCYAPYGYGSSYRRPHYRSGYARHYGNNATMGGYRGGGSGGGFGGSFGGFGGR